MKSPFSLQLARPRLNPELVLPAVVAALLAAMMVPLPAWLLDLGLAINLAASAALLIAALTVKDPLEVTAFPTLLLVTTLLRLSLNVSSTRLALAEGHAGQVIQAFGEFMVRGDYVVGFVVFAILSLVQFIVVAKGAERVAEVSARFMLDAMPGKQMSIDADLRAGAIDNAQAKVRRRALERESQMFGAMDGAMKFVKGDVIASFIIVGVNFIAGLGVGVLQNGMSVADAAGTYGLIALGDGLVSQIPSLCIAIAAGLLVTRVGSERGDALGAEIGRQFFGEPRVMFVVGGLLLALACMPGMPAFVFGGLAALVVTGGVLLHRKSTAAVAAREAGEGADPAGAEKPEKGAGAVALVTLDLGPDWSAFAQRHSAQLQLGLSKLRDRLHQDLGVLMPGVRVRTSVPSLAQDAYALLVDDVPLGFGAISPEGRYGSCRLEEAKLLGARGEALQDPANGRALVRVSVEEASTLEAASVQMRSGLELLTGHVAALLGQNAALLLGLQETQALLDGFEPTAPALVRSAVEKVPLPLLTDVFRRLLQEQVSIRNVRTLLEALVAPSTEGDAVQLAERCRQALSRHLSHRFAPSGMLYAYLLDPEVEELLRTHGTSGALGPQQVNGILEGVRRIANGGRAVVLASADVRRPLRKLCEGSFPDVAVLTYAELNPQQQIRPVGRLSLAA